MLSYIRLSLSSPFPSSHFLTACITLSILVFLLLLGCLSRNCYSPNNGLFLPSFYPFLFNILPLRTVLCRATLIMLRISVLFITLSCLIPHFTVVYSNIIFFPIIASFFQFYLYCHYLQFLPSFFTSFSPVIMLPHVMFYLGDSSSSFPLLIFQPVLTITPNPYPFYYTSLNYTKLHHTLIKPLWPYFYHPLLSAVIPVATFTPQPYSLG